jgi:hypothetical protein
MLVKKVSSDDIHHPQNAMKPSHTEGLLEAVDSCQDQTVQELLTQLDSVLAKKVILSFSFLPFSSSYLYVSLFCMEFFC